MVQQLTGDYPAAADSQHQALALYGDRRTSSAQHGLSTTLAWCSS